MTSSIPFPCSATYYCSGHATSAHTVIKYDDKHIWIIIVEQSGVIQLHSNQCVRSKTIPWLFALLSLQQHEVHGKTITETWESLFIIHTKYFKNTFTIVQPEYRGNLGYGLTCNGLWLAMETWSLWKMTETWESLFIIH